MSETDTTAAVYIRRAGVLRALLGVFAAECARTGRMLVRYPIGTLANVAILSLIFVGVFETARGMFDDAPSDDAPLSGLVQTFVLWSALITGFSSITGSIRDDTRSGLIEILWMGRFPAAVVLVMRAVISSVVVTVISIVIALCLSLVYQLSDVVTPALFKALGLVVPAALGLGLIFGAFVIVFKDIGPSVNLVQFLLLPVFMAYDSSSTIWVWLLPGLSGLDALACASCNTPLWLMLSLPPAIWLLAGLVTCAVAVRISKKRGLVYEY